MVSGSPVLAHWRSLGPQAPRVAILDSPTVILVQPAQRAGFYGQAIRTDFCGWSGVGGSSESRDGRIEWVPPSLS
jgi:hypothetical protein